MGFDAVVFDMDGVIFDSERATMECGLPMKPGIRELLGFLKEKDVKIAVASSTRKQTVENQLVWAGIREYFDAIICGDMVERSKPAPDIFLKVCEVLGVEPERAYVIEDSYNGIRAAHAGKLMPIMVPDLLPPTDEMHELAVAVLYDLNQVAEYLRIMELGGKSGLNFVAEMCPDIYEQTKAIVDRGNAGELPLAGIYLFIKDNIDVAGTHTTAGSLSLEDNLATVDAPVIRNLKKNGALILGKANMTEFANYTTPGMPGGYSSRGGQVIHATNPSLSPLGSSSGSAVAVSSGAVKAAIGTDTSFSVIACAQGNGVCGLKPAQGELSDEGIIPISHTLDSAAVLAWNFEDAVRVYNGMRDEPVEFKAADIRNLRVGVNLANEDKLAEEHRSEIDRFIEKLKDLGASIGTVNQPPTPQLMTIMQCEFRDQIEEYLASSNASRKTLKEIVEYFEANPETMMKYGDGFLRRVLEEAPLGMKEEKYIEAMKQREDLIKATYEEIKDFDVVFMTGPTYIMHLCGFPSATLALPELNSDGYRRCLIMYGAQERRLFEVVLGMSKEFCEK